VSWTVAVGIFSSLMRPQSRGSAPVNCSSGERTLIEASHRPSRYVPRWRQMKDHLGQGKAKSVATVAVANRWLRRLHYEMTRDVCEKTTA